ncbi:UNVERIFIED_CONTAM: hypothetical protein GTU68_054169, partial [Idotea baltica]|nr:hypothetical protein [Idotea baltica]
MKPCTKDDNFISTSLASVFSDLSNTCPLILNDFNVVNIDINNENVDIALSTRDGNPILIEKTTIPLLSINVESKANKPLQDLFDIEETDSVTESNFSRTLVHEKTFEDLVKLISQDLNLTASSPLCPQFIMLQGSKGSGKTTVMENVVRKLSASPYFIHCEVIHLKLLKGKRVDSVKKELLTSIRKALDYQPSLIVLDDLDFLAPSEIQEEKGPLFEHLYSMSFMFKSLLCQLLEDIKRNSSVSFPGRDFISIVATCCSRNGVHPMLSSPKGNHIFPKSVHIHPLNGEGKLIVIESLLQSFQQQFLQNNKISRCKDDLSNYIFQYSRNEIMMKLDGFTLPDLNSLALRIFIEAKARWKQDYKIEIDNHFIETDEHSKELFSFLNEDVTNALEGFVALSCKSLGFSTSLQKKHKIGGLKKAQAALEEMILWPSQYPDLFRQTQLRLRSGVLLYGPPGCGKTLLANSFKNASHLNFITVKGPELLSKYIGQSEKSVRDTFERAEMAKPCVLFFDEFDSMAPRRGHNNTGVTDRVVNQLLTQMDGVEGLSEVYVVAATSRPDLIDPALLRPG